MSTSRHVQIVETFLKACELSEDARQAYLDEACEGDPGMRAEVEDLLNHDRTRGLIDKPVVNMEWVKMDDVARDTTPSRVGRYEILKKLGEGGMGTVYEARQANPSRAVALKVIRPGLSSRALVHRFEQEAHLLGLLRDPGIAQIYEAGTADAGHGPQPFFAMELVDGPPLTDYAHVKKLDVRARLQLLTKVCSAVHHAHQKGIIHRDLKPSNILVDSKGQPKILDFGVARATDSDVKTTTLQTNVGQLVGTLPYMSPEQVSGDPNLLDIRSDVYALGVIGYELLTGRLPHDVQEMPLPEIVRVIKDEDPDRLSSVNRIFRGDIETIIAKAMDKDKERRYQSAAELSSDIERFLQDEPIAARPASAVYQFRKFARRNRAVVWSSASVMVTLVVALILTISYAVRATHAEEVATDQRDHAKSALSQSEAVIKFLTEMLRAVSPELKGRDVTVREILDESAKTIGDQLAKQPLVEARVRDVIGKSYSELGQPNAAEPHLLRALELREELLGTDHFDRIQTLKNLAMNHHYLGKFKEAESAWREAYELLQQTHDPEHEEVLHAMTGLGLAYNRLGRYDEAESLYLMAYDTRQRTLGPNAVATINNAYTLGMLYFVMEQEKEAELFLKEALAGERRIHSDDHPRALGALYGLSQVRERQRKTKEAVAMQIEVLEKGRSVFGEEHGFILSVSAALASNYGRLGRIEEAERLLTETMETVVRTLGEEHPESLSMKGQLAMLYEKMRRFEEAEPLILEVLDIKRRNLGDEHPSTLMELDRLGDNYRVWGQYDKAQEVYEQCLTARRRVLGDKNRMTLEVISDLGIVYYRRQQFEKAVELFKEAVESSRETLPADHDDRGTFLNLLSLALHKHGKTEESLPYVKEAYKIWSKTRGPTHPRTVLLADNLVKAYEFLGQPEKAEQWKAKLPKSANEEADSEK
ncbi:MAG: tetratricopeptide repeat protein [Phycisphaerales bacterium]|nr:tetratricopeptide repeat protein [Phycisphaerales bacterium]